MVKLDDMIVNIDASTKLKPIIAELFSRRRKFYVLIVSTSQP